MQVNIEFELSGKKPLCVSISEGKRLVKITLFFLKRFGQIDFIFNEMSDLLLKDIFIVSIMNVKCEIK